MGDNIDRFSNSKLNKHLFYLSIMYVLCIVCGPTSVSDAVSTENAGWTIIISTSKKILSFLG